MPVRCDRGGHRQGHPPPVRRAFPNSWSVDPSADADADPCVPLGREHLRHSPTADGACLLNTSFRLCLSLGLQRMHEGMFRVLERSRTEEVFARFLLSSRGCPEARAESSVGSRLSWCFIIAQVHVQCRMCVRPPNAPYTHHMYVCRYSRSAARAHTLPMHHSIVHTPPSVHPPHALPMPVVHLSLTSPLLACPISVKAPSDDPHAHVYAHRSHKHTHRHTHRRIVQEQARMQ